ncbi:hypothetical protein [Ekhidna sp.]|uniref:hypothetical protein n=1 Tax=Ekhidna sp. TaxID=2608089 RepID=UPI0032ED4576
MAIQIMNAVYASPNKGVDVTIQCQGLVDNGKTSFNIDPSTFGIPDPDFNVVKGFTITYGSGGKILYKGGKDGDTIKL